MVAQQGEMVDNIYQNVTRAGIDVEEGKNQLDQAKKLQDKNRKCKIIAACIITVLVLILLLVILNELGLLSYSSSPSETVTIIKEIHHYHNITQVIHETVTDTPAPVDTSVDSAITNPNSSSSIVTEEPIILVPNP